MSFGPWQIAIIVLLLVLLFGRGRISEMMGDVAKGIRSFKDGLADDGSKPNTENNQQSINHSAGGETVDTKTVKQDETTKS